MRKRLISPAPESTRTRGESRLDVERQAVVEGTAEEKNYPVESACVSGDARGWRAAASGSQTIRLVFDEPRRLRCIPSLFQQEGTALSQDLRIGRAAAAGHCARDNIRR